MTTTDTGQATASIQRPGWLIFVGVMAIVMGALTLLTVMQEFTSESLMTRQAELLRDSGASLDPTSKEWFVRFGETQQRMGEAFARGRPFLKALTPVGGLAALGMIGGAIGCLTFRRRAHLLLLAGLAFGLVYDVARAKPTLDRQSAIGGVMQAQAEQMMNIIGAGASTIEGQGHGSDSAVPQQTARVVLRGITTVIKLISIISVVAFLFAGVFLKLGFLVVGVFFLRRPSVRALFS